MEGDEIIFAPASQVYLYRLNAPEITESKNQLLNVNKSTKVDQNRKQYIEQNYNLPPNLLDVPTDPVRIQNNQIVIGGS
jgi:type IV secretory pathway protease TraF